MKRTERTSGEEESIVGEASDFADKGDEIDEELQAESASAECGRERTYDNVEERFDRDGAVPPGEVVRLDDLEGVLRRRGAAVEEEGRIPECGGEKDSKEKGRRADGSAVREAQSVVGQ